MAQKLWEKSVQVDRDVERFTVGRDREMDIYLAPYDILGSLAHIAMLEKIGLLTREELESLTAGLQQIAAQIKAGRFEIEPDVEDVHSEVELLGQCHVTVVVRVAIFVVVGPLPAKKLLIERILLFLTPCGELPVG